LPLIAAGTWRTVGFSIGNDGPTQTSVRVYVDAGDDTTGGASTTSFTVSQANLWVDTDDVNSVITIGGRRNGADTVTEMFQGFVFQIEMHNLWTPSVTYLRGTGCGACDACVSDNSCLNDWGFTKFGSGNDDNCH
jgi:hypothetical protein